ncbi:MAG: class I SAM-dependent methyltransferase [Ekhidna sp.]|nr:class I SAM-dependent methyltransferase [Ekhidna sp.]
MYERLRNCPICKNTGFQKYLVCKDHSVSNESFTLTKCSECELVFTNPRPNKKSLPEYYQSEDYISHTDKGNNLINLIYKCVRRYTIRKKFKLLRKYFSGKKLLDYGCGTGDFLNYVSRKNLQTFGYEPSKVVQEILKIKKINFVTNLKVEKAQYDIITAWHVIEHVPKPKKAIKLLRKKLTDSGTLFIAVPNIKSFDADYYQENWAGYDVPRHLYHFSRESFGRLIEKTKLKIIDTLPMKFDSYYASLLSEKYVNSKIYFFKALKIGKISNKKAKKTGEFSSLIYVLRK